MNEDITNYYINNLIDIIILDYKSYFFFFEFILNILYLKK